MFGAKKRGGLRPEPTLNSQIYLKTYDFVDDFTVLCLKADRLYF